MGLPEVIINFISKGVTAIQRSERGIMVLILNDDTDASFDSKVYANAAEIDATNWTPENKAFIEMAFWGAPNKVICERLAVAAVDDSDALTRILTKKWNWIAIPDADDDRTDALVSWIKDKTKSAALGGLDKTFKAVVQGPTVDPDHECIVNFTSEAIQVGKDGKFTLIDHGFEDGHALTFTATALPEGITAGVSYYVIEADTDTFQVSLEAGGDAVDVSTAGTDVVAHLKQIVSINDATEVITSAAHGLIDDETVRFSGSVLPTGIADDVDYYVISATTDTFQISLTEGGSAILFTDQGTSVSFIKSRTVTLTYGLEYTARQYCARIAGLLSGLPLTRSSTFYVLTEVVSATPSSDPSGDIDDGKMVLIDDGDNWKIGRGVNSYTSWVPSKGEDFSKIKIIEGMHLIRDDIRDTFEDDYIGKVINNYDNKVLFFAGVNQYFKEIAKPLVPVLDKNNNNTMGIDLDSQKAYIITKGDDPTDMTDKEILEYNTGSKVLGLASVKLVDAMEDLYIDINI